MWREETLEEQSLREGLLSKAAHRYYENPIAYDIYPFEQASIVGILKNVSS